jgi:hypothetical protein
VVTVLSIVTVIRKGTIEILLDSRKLKDQISLVVARCGNGFF